MGISTDTAVYRLRRFYRNEDKPKKYSGTYEIVDDNTEQVMAACDLIGKAVFATLSISDHENNKWQMKPNRKLMPSRWIVTDSRDDVIVQFDQKILGKLVNPLYKTLLAMLDRNGREILRLVDPRTSIPDRILGVSPGEWTVIRGDKPVAKLDRLPRKEEPSKGFFGKLRKLLASSDRGIISAGKEHALPAPVALGMLLLFEELTDTSAG